MKRKYPISIQTFNKIVEGGWRYVDKTRYIYQLVKDYTCVFLSRPRRFGKSLFTSTLHSYFEGRSELFEGLEISKLEKDWTKYPVFHFDMSTAKHLDSKKLEKELGLQLSNYEKIYGKVLEEVDCNQRLNGLIKRAYEQTGQKAVVLIDEYDAPLLDVLNDDEVLEANRLVMRNFYSPLKACDPYLRFVFITGVTKFSQLSIFSELNNLANISMMPEYAGICGITQEELETQFSDDVDYLAKQLKLTREETLTKLKERYDGYHFSEISPDVYNPFSLVYAFQTKRIKDYWFSSGTPTYLIDQMRRFGFIPQSLDKIEAMQEEFDAPTENMMSITPLLYQSGYVTIKDYDPESELYTLGLPNREVRTGLMRNMVPYVFGGAITTPTGVLVGNMIKAFNADDFDRVMELLQTFLASIPYTDSIAKDYEGYYQALLYVIFSMLCQFVDIEVRTPRGRADIIMNARNKIYVIEIKINKDAQFAIDQITQRNYAERFLITGKPVVRVGVNFSTEERNITDWQVVE